jgi:metal-dependent amidase/aminoacylase/carboxypeptidase family protein
MPAGRPPRSGTAHHTNRVVFDEDAMAAGVAVYAGPALDLLVK